MPEPTLYEDLIGLLSDHGVSDSLCRRVAGALLVLVEARIIRARREAWDEGRNAQKYDEVARASLAPFLFPPELSNPYAEED